MLPALQAELCRRLPAKNRMLMLCGGCATTGIWKVYTPAAQEPGVSSKGTWDVATRTQFADCVDLNLPRQRTEDLQQKRASTGVPCQRTRSTIDQARGAWNIVMGRGKGHQHETNIHLTPISIASSSCHASILCRGNSGSDLRVRADAVRPRAEFRLRPGMVSASARQ